MDLLTQVRRTIQRHELAGPGTRVMVALSGGSDSVALAHVLTKLARAGELLVVGAAHFNHQLRDAADDDERFAAQVAAGLGLPFVAGRGDVRALAKAGGGSVEAAGHAARHEFLDTTRRQLDAEVVALGHTRDDQAETFLLRLMRGAGARGLAAMHPRRGPFVRPLIACRRAELRDYLAASQIEWRDDPTNDDLQVPRNRVRLELLPLLERRFNPAVVDVLADEAELARAEWAWMDAASAEAEASLSRPESGGACLDAAALAAAPEALARLIVQRLMARTASGRAVSFAHVERALDLARRGGRPFAAPGQVVERRGPDVVLTGRAADSQGRREAGSAHFFRYPLSIPGEVAVAESGCVVSAEAASRAPAASAMARNSRLAVLQLDSCPRELAVRNRRPGDRFRPLGLGGQKKLQDFFVDRKVAQNQRDSVPIVVTDTDKIVWVGGHAIDEAFRVTDPAQAVIILRLKLPGGPA